MLFINSRGKIQESQQLYNEALAIVKEASEISTDGKNIIEISMRDKSRPEVKRMASVLQKTLDIDGEEAVTVNRGSPPAIVIDLGQELRTEMHSIQMTGFKELAKSSGIEIKQMAKSV